MFFVLAALAAFIQYSFINHLLYVKPPARPRRAYIDKQYLFFTLLVLVAQKGRQKNH